MMVTVFCSDGAACLAADFAPASETARGRAAASFSSAGLRRPDRNPRHRFAAQRIVVEEGEAGEGHQKQAEQDGERLDSGKRQPEPALSAHRLLSKRSAQIIGRLCHRTPQINRADDTTARQDRGSRGTLASQSTRLTPQADSLAADLSGSDAAEPRPNLLF